MPVCIFTAHEKNFLSRGAGEDKPKSKEDFQRLYAELESWRMKQEKKISDAVKPGSSPGRFCYFLVMAPWASLQRLPSRVKALPYGS